MSEPAIDIGRLTPEQRLRLLEKILDSLSDDDVPLSDVQREELDRRLDGEVLAGSIRSRAVLRLIKEWTLARNAELQANWGRARRGEPLERIAPLD